MITLPKNHTHIAHAYQRTGRKSGRLLEVGSGRIDAVRNVAHIVMNRQPIGGYTGYIQLLPIGVKPVPQDGQPEQMDDSAEDYSDAV